MPPSMWSAQLTGSLWFSLYVLWKDRRFYSWYICGMTSQILKKMSVWNSCTPSGGYALGKSLIYSDYSKCIRMSLLISVPYEFV